MARTVKVNLIAEVSQYLHGTSRAERATKDLGRSLNDTARTGDRTASAMGSVASGYRDVGAEAKRAGADIQDANNRMAALSRDSAGRLRDSKGRFAGAGASAGADLGQAMGRAVLGEMGKVFSALPPQAKAAAAGIGLAMVPALGAALSGGIMAGLAGGGVAAGIALAVRDPRVKAAGSQLGKTLSEGLQGAAQPFIQPTLAAIGIMRSEFDASMGDIRAIFASASRYVTPLARAIAGLVSEALPGIARAMDRAQPVVAVLERALPRIGAAVSRFFDDISSNADDAAGGLEGFLMFVEKSIGFAGRFIGAITDMFSAVVNFSLGAAKAFEWLPDWHPLGKAAESAVDNLTQMKAAIDGGTGAAATSAPTFGALGSAYRGTAQAGMSAAESVRATTDAVRAQQGAVQGSFDAQTRMAQAMRDAAAAARENNAGIDLNSKAARRNFDQVVRNRQALSDLGSATLAARDKMVAQGGTQAEVNAIMRRGYDAFVRAADGMRVSRAKADELARAIGLIPPAKNVKINAPTAGARAEADRLRAKLQALERTYSARVVTTHVTRYVTTGRQSSQGERIPGQGTQVKYRWGGITEHAQTGLLRQARIEPGRDVPLVSWAERATGGELFAPRRGDMARTRALVDHAVENWWGGKVDWTAGSGGGWMSTSRGSARSAVVHQHYHLTATGPIGSRMELEQWFDGMYDSARRRGATGG